MRSGVPGGPGKLAEVSRRRAVAALGTLVLALAGAAVLPGPRTAAAAARPTRPALVFSPSRYDYGQVSPGQSASQTFILSNSGQKATGRLRVQLSGPAAFSITGSTCRATRLRPGGACAITVRFAPSRPGRITATLTAASKGGSQHATTASGALTGAGRALGAAPGQIIWVSTDEIWTANLDGTSPHAIVTGQVDPEGIAANSSHLYWADGAAGTIWEANLDGSSPHIIVTSQRGQAGLAVTPSHIYWANEGGGEDRAGTIWAANLDGSNPHVIVTGQTLPAGVAADASHVYWADDGNETAGNGTISEASPDGTSPHTIVTGQTVPAGVAVDASHLYWASLGNDTAGNDLISEANLDGTSPHTIVTGQNNPSGVASDSSHVYWASNGDGTVNQVSPDGSSPHTIVTGQDSPTWMAVTPAAADLSFSPVPYDYGSVSPGQTATQLFTLANSGQAATGPLTVTVPGSAAFTTTSDACTGSSLAPGQSCQVTVKFAPASTGAVTATLTAASQAPAATATDALTGTGVTFGHIYWGDALAGTVNAAGLDGSNPHALVTGQNLAFGVAVGSHLYWDDTDGISEANLDGTAAHLIVSQPGPAGLALADGHLYWANQTTNTIWVASADGTGARALVTGQSAPTGLAAGDGNLYWANNRDGAIWTASLDGTGAHAILTGQDQPFGVAVTASHLFWGNFGHGAGGKGAVWTASLDGTSPQIIARQDCTVGVAAGPAQLYWIGTCVFTGTIHEAGLDGSNPQTLLTDPGGPQWLAVGP